MLDNIKPPYDKILVDIADYVLYGKIESSLAYDTARLGLMDSLGCAILALSFPACVKLLGPIVPGAVLKGGARVPGTNFELDPVQAAFNIGTMIRWLDFNDTWLAAEWGHPSDNLGAILALSDYLVRQGQAVITMRDILTMMIKAYEIQGILALKNSFNHVGLDHVVLVKLASAAIASFMLDGDKNAMLRTLSQVFVDGQSLRTYRHSPNTGSRKSWAAGDATARGIRLALLSHAGEMGYPSVLTAKIWGFYDVSLKQTLQLDHPLGSYVMENILFKLSYPAEFHAQTAVECAVKLYPLLKDKWEDIQRIEIYTHASALRIINKTGPLYNPADRDHCLQYMVAIALLYGTLEASHYEEKIARDPRIDMLRNTMVVQEDRQYSEDYLDAEKRSIANRLHVFFKDGSTLSPVEVEYPIGHRRRRAEGIPVLIQKCQCNLRAVLPELKVQALLHLWDNPQQFDAMRIDNLMNVVVF